MLRCFINEMRKFSNRDVIEFYPFVLILLEARQNICSPEMHR